MDIFFSDALCEIWFFFSADRIYWCLFEKNYLTEHLNWGKNCNPHAPKCLSTAKFMEFFHTLLKLDTFSDQKLAFSNIHFYFFHISPVFQSLFVIFFILCFVVQFEFILIFFLYVHRETKFYREINVFSSLARNFTSFCWLCCSLRLFVATVAVTLAIDYV